MEYAECRHPFETIDRKSLVVLADYVTLEAGTGCVHTAPGHGADDFETGVRYNLPIICPVDGSGKLTAEAGADFAGMFVFDANVPIIKYLVRLNRLFGKTSAISMHTAGAARTPSSTVRPSSGSHLLTASVKKP